MVIFKNREFYIDYEASMDRGYGEEASSDMIYLSFNENSELEEATLFGMHYITELEFELEANITTEEAKEIVENYLIKQGAQP